VSTVELSLAQLRPGSQRHRGSDNAQLMTWCGTRVCSTTACFGCAARIAINAVRVRRWMTVFVLWAGS
jgi:hypothetical protein